MFSLLLAYIAVFENNTVYNPRSSSSYYVKEDIAERIIEDPQAPEGIHREFTWTLGDAEHGTDCLAFYLVHTYAEVRINGELVYSLSPGEDNPVGSSVSSNWVLVPLSRDDSGREVQVTLTPVYKSVTDRSVQFLIGSRSEILRDCLKRDIPQIVLSSLCIFVGVLIMATQTIINIRKKMTSWNLLLLGLFSFLLGLWRITDTRSSPLLFPENTMVLGYITIGAMFVLPLPLLLYIKDQFTGRGEKAIRIVLYANCAASFVALICQAFNIADFRESLIVSHVLYIINIITMLSVSVVFRSQIHKKRFWLLIVLVVSGTLMDIICYYIKGSSSGILFSITAILIYIVFQFFDYLSNINRQAYADVQTELFNKRYWDELMEENKDFTEPIGIIMMDLNHLKHTNDTMGHKAGDKMLISFAKILKETIPHSTHICRWGGDEFAVMINKANKSKVIKCVSDIKAATRAYNAENDYPHIFASGYALSSDFPDLSLKKLFEKADEYMYLDKQQWYEDNSKS